MRIDPTKLVPGAKSVVSLMYNYFPGEMPDTRLGDARLATEESDDSRFTPDDNSRIADHGSRLKISRYAYGEDYHKVVRRKLKSLLHEMKTEFGNFHGRVFVDSAPVMERDWAKRSGLGWTGKNTLLIDPKNGSYFFLAEIICDLEFEYESPDAGSLWDMYTMHRCLSYRCDFTGRIFHGWILMYFLSHYRIKDFNPG
jgi:epoxyqueuosine reductase